MSNGTSDGWATWDFANLYQGFANTTTQDAIVSNIGAGVFPPNYRTNAHYVFHHRMGQNVRCAPILLPIDDKPQSDLNYPALVNQPSLVTLGPPEWLLKNKWTGTANNSFPALDIPPAPPSLPWMPL